MKNNNTAGVLYGIGVGPGDPELITVKAINTIKKCDYIAVPCSGSGEPLAYAIGKKAVPEIVQMKTIDVAMPMTRNQVSLGKSHEKALQVITDLLDQGADVGFLTLGDPTIYSTYIYIHERVISKGYVGIIIPGIPSFCAVAARLNIGLTEASQPLHILPGSYEGIDEGLALKGTKVLMKTGKSIEKVKELLTDKGLLHKTQMVENCGMECERVIKLAEEENISDNYFTIIVVKDTGE